MENKILVILRKLIAQEQSERSIGNQNAAERFAEKIQELLSKHNVSMSDVEVQEEKTFEQVDEEIFVVGTQRRQPGWQRVLMSGITKANNCELIVGIGSNKYYIVGTKTNRKLVMTLFVYFSDLSQYLALKEQRTRNESVSFKNSYLVGFATAIGNRMREKNTEVKTEAKERAQLTGQNCQALVRLDAIAVANKQLVEKNHPNLKTTSTKYREDGFHVGHAAGNRVALTSQTIQAA